MQSPVSSHLTLGRHEEGRAELLDGCADGFDQRQTVSNGVLFKTAPFPRSVHCRKFQNLSRLLVWYIHTKQLNMFLTQSLQYTPR